MSLSISVSLSLAVSHSLEFFLTLPSPPPFVGSVIVHVMTPQMRNFYKLEKRWKEAEVSKSFLVLFLTGGYRFETYYFHTKFTFNLYLMMKIFFIYICVRFS